MIQDVKLTVINEKVQEIFDHFCHSFQIRVLFQDLEGNILIEGLRAHDSSYCSLLRKKLGLERVCLTCDRENREKTLKSGKLVTYTCHSGLLEAVYPLFSSGRHLGYAMIGQIRIDRTAEPAYNTFWREKFGNDQLEKAFYQLPVYSKKQIDHILGLFVPLMDYIVEHEFITSQRHRLVEKLLEYLQYRSYSAIKISEAADYLGKSPSTITHTLRELTGKSFKEFCIEYRLRQAEKLMRQCPGITVREAADSCGYGDPFYFSRIFSKYRGITPSEFLRGHTISEDAFDKHLPE